MGYGLRPYGGLSGGYQSGGFNEYPIFPTEADTMFTGGLALLEASGYVTALAATPTGATAVLSTLGVFAGFRWTDPTGQPRHSMYYDGNDLNTEPYAFIYDSPTQLFLVKSDGAIVQADMGLNANLISDASDIDISLGSTVTGLSEINLDQSSRAVAGTLSVRLIAIPKDGVNENSTTPNVVVMFRPGDATTSPVHQMASALGV